MGSNSIHQLQKLCAQECLGCPKPTTCCFNGRPLQFCMLLLHTVLRIHVCSGSQATAEFVWDQQNSLSRKGPPFQGLGIHAILLLAPAALSKPQRGGLWTPEDVADAFRLQQSIVAERCCPSNPLKPTACKMVGPHFLRKYLQPKGKP